MHSINPSSKTSERFNSEKSDDELEVLQLTLPPILMANVDYKRLLQINPKFVYAYHRYHLTLGIVNANNGRV